MEIKVIRDKLFVWVKKYRYALLVLLGGILLMLIPAGKKETADPLPAVPTQQKPQLEITARNLETVLSQIKGAGKVEVLLTLAAGERTVFQTNDRSSSDENSKTQEFDTVLISDSNRSEEALIAQIVAPEYLGAVIVCQGAEDPSVRLAVSDAVSKATGLGTDRISVVKMK